MATKTPKPQLSAKDKFAALKTKAKPKAEKKSKSTIRDLDLTGSDSAVAVADLCELAYLGNVLAPLIEQHKNVVQDAFFERWTKEMFDTHKLPENFKARLKKKDGDKVTSFEDAACNFVLKFRDDGLKGKLPKAEDLPEDQTTQEVLIEMLQSGVVGMSPDNAQKFVAEEVVTTDITNFPATLAEMLASEDGTFLSKLGEFLANCIAAKSSKEYPPVLSEEDKTNAIETKEIYALKDGVEERLLSYVDTLEQLRNLLKFISVTKQVSNFEFGISDEVADRNKRLTDIARRWINLGK